MRRIFRPASIILPESFPPIVCLCGSTRFHREFHDVNLRMTMQGIIVLSIGIDTKSDTDLLIAGEITSDDKVRLDTLHKRKIDLADFIFVLNVGGYVGSSTQSEIIYAREAGKLIEWLEPDKALALPELDIINMSNRSKENHG